MSKRLTWLVVSILVLCAPVRADDVEIYFVDSGPSAGTALVMFSLDYRPNLNSTSCNGITVDAMGAPDFSSCPWTASFPAFNSAFEAADYADGTIVFLEMLRASLRYVLTDSDFQAANLRVGLMLNHDHKNNCEGRVTSGCSNGGYIAMGFRDHNSIPSGRTQTGTEELLGHLASIPLPAGSLSHPFQGKELYFELFRYLTGQGVFNGHVGFNDYGDDCASDNLNDTVNPTPGCRSDTDVDVDWDASIESGGDYLSPWETDELVCSGVHVINFMFGVSNQDDDSDSQIEAGQGSGGLGIALSGRSQFGQVIERMHDVDLADGTWGSATDVGGTQNVVSHFVFNGNLQNTMNGYALAGGGTAIEVSDNPSLLVSELKGLFVSILRQNSTFEAPAVAVNSYNRLSHLDALYYALFTPEEHQNWPGNLKKYRLGEIEVDDDSDSVTDYTVVAIVDADGDTAITDSGLFDASACSYWTDCAVAGADGDEVAEGGAAGQLTTARNVYTNTGSGSGEDLSASFNAVHENNSSVTAAMLDITGDNPSPGDVTDSEFREDLLRIARGVDEDDTTIALRTIGDPIHSRPLVVVYDGDVANGGVNPDIGLVLTTNEGYMHMFDADDGSEVFAFIPQELLPLVRKINKETSSSSSPYRYGIYGLDGSPVLLRIDNDDDGVIESSGGDRTIVYLTQRRGGRNVYAVDVTDRTAPVLLWRILGGVTSGFSDLAETWSEPVLTKIKVGGTETHVLVFGGGYDSDRYDHDADDPDDDADMGRSVYVVNAFTGDLIWRIGPDASASFQLTSMTDSIPGSVKVIDFHDDGIADRFYFSDIVGRIHRVDLSNTTTATSIFGGGLLMDLSSGVDQDACDTEAAGNACRRFYHSLDVAVITGLASSPYIQLAVGSGFRAHPKEIATQDRYYVVYDNHVLDQVATADYASAYAWTESNLVDVTDIGTSSTLEAKRTALAATLTAADKHGWYINMDASIGEKVLSESVTLNGMIVFTTYSPSLSSVGGVCSAGLGGGRVYLMNAYDGLPALDFYSGTGDLLAYDDTVRKEQRYSLLPREGMPTEPSVVFKQKDDGTIVPQIVVGTQLPIDSDVLNMRLQKATWWLGR